MDFFIYNLALMTFLFLYTELAEYVLACCNKLSIHGDVHIICWPVNKEAPFVFTKKDNLKIYSKNNYTFSELEKLVTHINPTVIVCSGWIDKDYLKISKDYFKKTPTIMTCDTAWRGDFKQYVAVALSRLTLLNIFSNAWVPGEAQKKYALKLGFQQNKIETGFYSCDLNFFENIYQIQKEKKRQHFPKRFIYVGRYYDFKGIQELWQAFIEVQNEKPNTWELWCLGVGDIEPINHQKIKHFGFVQPIDIADYSAQTGVFILPSRKEPWGVVVHEFASLGFPLLLSKRVGAKEKFLQEGKNGFEFEAQNVKSIKQTLKKIMDLTEIELLKMSEVSSTLSKSISPETWVNSLLKMANDIKGV